MFFCKHIYEDEDDEDDDDVVVSDESVDVLSDELRLRLLRFNLRSEITS